MIMDNDQVAAILDEIATLLELQGENPFRCQAYRNAARAIQQMEGRLSELVAAGKLTEIRGIGETLQEKITALVISGRLAFYDDLKSKIPTGSGTAACARSHSVANPVGKAPSVGVNAPP